MGLDEVKGLNDNPILKSIDNLKGNIWNGVLESVKSTYSNIQKMKISEESFDEKGIYTMINGNKVYEWRDGKEEGVYYYRSRSRDFIYIGNFKNGKFDGEGRMIFSNGYTFVGTWKAGQLDSGRKYDKEGNPVDQDGVVDAEVAQRTKQEMDRIEKEKKKKKGGKNQEMEGQGNHNDDDNNGDVVAKNESSENLENVGTVNKKKFDELCKKDSLLVDEMEQIVKYVNENKIKELNLGVKSLDGDVVESLGNLSSLEELYLDNLEKLTTNLVEKLKNLSLRALTLDELFKLDDDVEVALGGLTSLEYLSLGNLGTLNRNLVTQLKVLINGNLRALSLGLGALTDEESELLGELIGLEYLSLNNLLLLEEDVVDNLKKLSLKELYLDKLETDNLVSDLLEIGTLEKLSLIGLTSIESDVVKKKQNGGVVIVSEGLKKRLEYENLCKKDSLLVDEMEQIVKYVNENGIKELNLGVKSLDGIAVELGKLTGLDELSLDGLESIDNGVAAELGTLELEALSLDGLKSISKEVAAELGKLKYLGELSLDGLKSISKEVVAELGTLGYLDELSLDGLESIDNGVAAELGKLEYLDELSLDGLTSIDEKVATELGTLELVALSLDGLESISKGVVKELGKLEYLGELSLDGLESIDNGVAAELGKLKLETLSLDGLKSISKEVVKELGTLELEALSLDGLTSISKEVVAELGELIRLDELSLNGLESIKEEVVDELVKMKNEKVVKISINPNILTPEQKNRLGIS